jgi:hypothetical protein
MRLRFYHYFRVITRLVRVIQPYYSAILDCRNGSGNDRSEVTFRNSGGLYAACNLGQVDFVWLV